MEKIPNNHSNNPTTGIEDYNMSDVRLTNAYLKNANDIMRKYLLSLDVNKFAAGFREMAGIAHSESPYGGWESGLIGGHSVGHYMLALAQEYALSLSEEPDVLILEKLNALIDALNEAQIKEDGVVNGQPVKKGFLFSAAPKNRSDPQPLYGEQQFDNIELGKDDLFTQAWVPWYTMHKILAGLVGAYKLTGNKKALETADLLGSWVYNRVKNYDTTFVDGATTLQQQVLRAEYGGMNDALYELYKLTGNPNHAKAAHMFDEIPLFDKLYNNIDILPGKHANTTIPKIIGALNRYRTCKQMGNKLLVDSPDSHEIGYYLTVAKNFWDIVINSHTYITGGNSDSELFKEPHTCDAHRSNINCETCNTYNMLKLSRELYKITGLRKYADYYENTFMNAIVSSQNPETGMTMYFQPMASGYFKVYSDPYENFWCCTGSGMESMTKLNDSIYFRKGSTVIVNQYISSVLTNKENGVVITQQAEIPYGEKAAFKVTFLNSENKGTADKTVSIMLRIPDWTVDCPVIKVNGVEFDYAPSGGYATITGLGDGDSLEITLPMKLQAYGLDGSNRVVAFKYGPALLSANLGEIITTKNTQHTENHGIEVRKPLRMEGLDEYIVIDSEYGTPEKWLDKLDENVIKTEGKLEFRLKNTNRSELVFTPHYSKYNQYYGIYWYLSSDCNQ